MFEEFFNKSEYMYLLVYAIASVCYHIAMIVKNAYYNPNDPKSRTNPIAQHYRLDKVIDLDIKWVNRMVGYPQIVAIVICCMIGRFNIVAGAVGLLVSSLLLSNISMHIVGKYINGKK